MSADVCSDAQVIEALGIATKMHAGQVDKAGRPYMLHVLTVTAKVERDARHLNDANNYAVVAILHDVDEDTSYTIWEIRRDFGDTIADAVDAISRRDGEVYLSEYIPRLKENEIARFVKRRDIEHHLERADPGTESLQKKYRKAQEALESAA